MHEESTHPDALGAGKFVVGAVANVERFCWINRQLPARLQVQPGVGLAVAARAREDLRCKEPGERGLTPHIDDVLTTYRNQACPDAAPSQFVKRLDHTIAWRTQQLCRKAAAELDEPIGVFSRHLNRREVRTQGAGVPNWTAFPPEGVERIKVLPKKFRRRRRERSRFPFVVVDESLEKVEDDRSRHAVALACRIEAARTRSTRACRRAAARNPRVRRDPTAAREAMRRHVLRAGALLTLRLEERAADPTGADAA